MKTYKIAITTGDKKGIGKEITKKALDILKPDKKDILIIGEKVDCDYDEKKRRQQYQRKKGYHYVKKSLP